MKHYPLIILAIFPMVLFASTGISDAMLGDMNKYDFVAYVIFGVGGILVALLKSLSIRNKDKDGRPAEFSLTYWWNDNYGRLALSLVALPFAILLYGEFMSDDMNNFNSFMLGFSSDSLIEVIKKRSVNQNR